MSHTKPHGPTRTETDTMGPIQVPADRYWGAQTERSHHHFPFGDRMPLAIVHAFGLLKAACAQANADMGGLAANLRDLIVAAAKEVSDGKLDGLARGAEAGFPGVDVRVLDGALERDRTKAYFLMGWQPWRRLCAHGPAAVRGDSHW